ncbi:hypothetical protein [Mycolicibacterium mucogenicum]|uniref:Uncharacterized protein n=1 Tax=Mycolicibacterium mucogenicum DSM 44124 TaxID=1226753 RepID=A0A8E4RA46_MYCMU|nr:hypothetical protein [Mycolicibacterium mucogenicum]QPG70350.1 hypothetical protein C1S78_004915 [Mycolicibacterium mucogenicum DSM 44124]
MGALLPRRYAGVPALGCAIGLTILFGGAGVVFADTGSTPTTSTAPTTTASPALKALPPVIAAPAPDADSATLTLAPSHGGSGTQVTATITGFDYCLDSPHLLWDGGPLSAGSDLTFTVPDSPAGAHRVTAVCRLLDGARTVAPASFTIDVTEKPTLTLEPGKGPAGSQVTATPKGFGRCLDAPRLQWDGQPLTVKAVDPAVGSLAFTVPDGPATGHTVTAVCGSLRKLPVAASAPFTVVETPKPTLTLSTPKGTAGSQVTATGTGFACPDSGDVLLFWDGDKSPSTKASPFSFRVPFTVPATASVGEYTVLAACADDPDVAASEQFTVVSPVTNQGAAAASIALDPTQGHGGEAVHIVGSQFLCADHERTVKLSWDGAPPRFEVALDGNGHFATWFAVPSDAAVGSHTVRASCADGSAWDTGDFAIVTVGLPVPPPVTTPTAPPPPIIPPPPPHKWWPLVLVAAVIAVLLLAAAVHVGRRALRTPQVRVITRLGGPAAVTLRATPAAGEATYAVHVAVHSKPDVVTLREVDDDRIRVD